MVKYNVRGVGAGATHQRIKEVFLVFRCEEELVVMGYNDASFQTYVDDSKS
jgi:hypothetical protein